MAKIKLNGDTSGYIEISAPAVSGNNTLELGPGTKILTNLDNTFTGVSTFSSDVYLGNDIYLTDGSSGYEKVEVGANDIRVESKHVHSEFGVWTRSSSLSDRRNGIDGTGNDLRLYSNYTEKVRISSDGKVGINTASPRAVLDIEGNAENFTLFLHSNDANANLQFSDNTGGARILNYGGDLAFRTGTNPHAFGAGDSEALRITSDNKLGINITNPTRQLEIYSSSHATAALQSDTQSSLFFSDPSDTNIGQISYMHSGNYMYFRVNDAERLRITSGGDVLIGGQTAYTYDDTGASNTILDIWNSGNNKRGILSLSGNTNGGASIGTIWFNNDNNSGASPGNNMKLSAAIQSQAVTSDSNAGNDAGATLQFLTKPEGSPMVESMRITSDGDIYQRNQRVHTCLHTEYRQLSGGVNTDSVGSFVDIKNFTYTPKRTGSLIVCHFQVQTWNGSQTTQNGDIYFRARFDQGTGTYVNVTYGGNNNRVTGNFDQDNNRQHLYYTHTFGFIAQNTNQHTIKLQASNGSSLSTDFNWFHTGDNANGCWIFEYDQ